MTDPEELYESILGRVGDGLDVDWKALEARCPELAVRWHGLRRVQEISSAFRRARQAPETPEASPSTENEKAPVTWGALRLGEKIGEGSFAEVYRAHDPVLERDVALKLARGAAARPHQRFLDEGRRLARVDHPGVIRAYGAAVHDGRAGVWMDLATGRSLGQRLTEDGRFSEIETVDVARQLSSALTAVHGAGLVHGDIKAANVLRRDGGAIMLGDFGSSLDLRFGPREPGSATLRNAAPEILRGEPADTRSDIYSLGVLLFNLLTDAFPFAGDSLAAIQAAHREHEPVRVRDLRPDISPALAALVDRAVAVGPAKRWQSARQLHDAIDGIGRGSNGPHSSRLGPRPLIWAVLFAAVLIGWLAMRDGFSTRRPPVSPAAETAATPDAMTFTQAAASQADQLRVGLFRAGAATALLTGDRVDVGDALHLRIDDNAAPLWLYLVNEDAQGRVYKLFPLAGVEPSNPLPAGDLRLPGRIDGVEQDWVVTSEGQTESFLLVASRAPLPELERALSELEGASVDRIPQGSSTFASPTRGVGGLEAAVEAAASGTLSALREIALTRSSGDEDAEIKTVRTEIVTLRGDQAPRP